MNLSLSGLWNAIVPSKFVTVATVSGTYTSEEFSENTVFYALQESASGRRRVQMEQSFSPFKAKDHQMYFNHILPWKEGTKELHDLIGFSTFSSDPHVFEQLEYKLLGSSDYEGRDQSGKNCSVHYYFYEHENGQRRLTRESSPSKTLTFNNGLHGLYRNWEKGRVVTENLPHFTPFDPKQTYRKTAQNSITEKNGDVITVDFGPKDPE